MTMVDQSVPLVTSLTLGVGFLVCFRFGVVDIEWPMLIAHCVMQNQNE